jgi:hypothetical protein
MADASGRKLGKILWKEEFPFFPLYSHMLCEYVVSYNKMHVLYKWKTKEKKEKYSHSFKEEY